MAREFISCPHLFTGENALSDAASTITSLGNKCFIVTDEMMIKLGNIKKLTEEAKVSLRNERRDSMDAIKAMKKENIITEDEQADAEKEIQKKVDSYNAKIDAMCQVKEKEIMEV